ncbi:MAG: TIGR01777 family oxidoreductase [Actinomycetota bacterium]|nr:TIGR01777 family oxidoreductase [Actinomycetota bacterium]
MRFLIAGSSGFLGTELTRSLRTAGHTVTTLVRRAARADHDEATWDPYHDVLERGLLEESDVVVNLAGSPTAGNPHSQKWADELLRSRVTTTRLLARRIAEGDRRPAYLAGNGISFYGDHGDLPLTETADSRGSALLTKVTRAWQEATQPAADAGARVVVLRTSPVLDARSSPLKQLLLLFRLGLGGPIGNGEQYFPVISTRDWVGAVTFAAEHEQVVGPVNLCLPEVPTNAEFTRELGRLVHRPTLLRVPVAAIRVVASRLAPEVLGSVRAVPQALLDAGYAFHDRDITALLSQAVNPER